MRTRANYRVVFNAEAAMTDTPPSACEAPPPSGASSVKAFCERNDIGTTTFYEEVRAGRLIARKVRSKTIVTSEDEIAWRQSLPRLQPRAA
jgi:hypothetical protein